MPGIALKYWAFEQNGWGHVDETNTPPPVPEPEVPQPEIQGRSDYQEWKWTGVPGKPLELVKKPPITRIEPRILTVLNFYTYSTEKYELEVRAQEKLPFATISQNIVECEHYSILTVRNFHNYISVGIQEPRQHTNSPIFTYENIPDIREVSVDHREEILLYNNPTGVYGEFNVRDNTPLSIAVNLRERHESRSRSIVPIPFYVRTPILEYVKWHKQQIVEGIGDDTLLAALAHIIIDLEENN